MDGLTIAKDLKFCMQGVFHGEIMQNVISYLHPGTGRAESREIDSRGRQSQ